MHTAVASLQSISTYSQNRYFGSLKEPKETHADYEKRIWPEKLHRTESGHVFIPPMAFKNCLSESAKFTSRQIPGKGKSTYTKHIESGVLVTEGLTLDIKVEDVKAEVFFVPADGRRGGGKRVEKSYPIIPEWHGDVTFYVLDDTVTKDVFIQTLEEAGNFIGIGVFRPRNNGYWGRFKVEKVQWD